MSPREPPYLSNDVSVKAKVDKINKEKSKKGNNTFYRL